MHNDHSGVIGEMGNIPGPSDSRDASARASGGGSVAILPRIEVRSKLWMEVDGVAVLGDWRAALLEAIDRTGSLAGACEEMNVPYRTAWQRLKESEERLGFRLVTTVSGGADGGGSTLTPEARDLLSRYRRFSEGIEDLVNARFREAFG